MSPVIARFISYLFHPLLLPAFGYAYLLFALPEAHQYTAQFRWSYYLAMVFFTGIMPGLGILLLYYLKAVPSLHMENRQERTNPLLFTAVIYIGVLYLVGEKVGMRAYFMAIHASATVVLVLVSFITLLWKISAHAAGMGGLLGVFLCYQIQLDKPLFLIPILACILVAGLVGTSRLQLSAHTPLQVFAGYFMGLSGGFGTTDLLFYLN